MTNDIPPTRDAQPIACTLSGAAVADRQLWLSAVMQQATDVSVQRDGLTAHFAPAEDLERELRAIAAAEARCCPFLRIEVSRGDGRLSITVTGPSEAKPIIEEMFEAANGH